MKPCAPLHLPPPPPVPQQERGAARGKKSQDRQASLVEQFSGNQVKHHRPGPERIPFPDGFPAAVIDQRSVGEQRYQLKCRDRERHSSDRQRPTHPRRAR